jgi:AGZA family xanthine/uracil permease-like MFS transporter
MLHITSTGMLPKPDVPVRLGNLRDPQVLLAIGGFLLMTVLLARDIRGAILIGMIVTAAAGYACGLGHAPQTVMALPFSGDYDLSVIALQLDVRSVLQIAFLPILLTLFLMSFLDTLGTLVGVGAAGNLLDNKGNFPEVERPMMVDALSCIFGALIGTSTSGAYIESATGIRAGARTGLAAVTTAILFAASLFFLPLAGPLQQLTYAYGPALIAVGMLMLGSVTKIDFADLTEVIPAFATIAMMLFTYNIANGLTAGLVLYPLVKLATGQYRDVTTGSAALAVLCLVYYVFGLPH